jgi:hypothetical protein
MENITNISSLKEKRHWQVRHLDDKIMELYKRVRKGVRSQWHKLKTQPF